MFCFFFFFNDTATTEIYTLSLHDALPILMIVGPGQGRGGRAVAIVDPGIGVQAAVAVIPVAVAMELGAAALGHYQDLRAGVLSVLRIEVAGQHADFLHRVQAYRGHHLDRKSTRLNSSHLVISYA